jgi:hypothetical protein
MWWRLVGSALEHAAKLVGQKLDFKDLFTTQEEDDEESASLTDMLEVLAKRWPKGFIPLSLAKMVNSPTGDEYADASTVRDFLLGGEDRFISDKTVGKLLKPYIDMVTPSGLVLRKHKDSHAGTMFYRVVRLKKDE